MLTVDFRAVARMQLHYADMQLHCAWQAIRSPGVEHLTAWTSQEQTTLGRL